MEEQNFNELSGQTEAIALVLIHLIASLEIKGAIDGEKLTSQILQFSEQRTHNKPWLPVTKRVVKALVDEVVAARKVRHKRNQSAKNQSQI